ncbi:MULTISPECIES: RsfA family transcriptional regulator [unclassified Virgibacillus]|uniref:RsfA family transcriptional regulator n=1 Tax=unclassified Virgibacillus TaxID=2620237 RepID=UPI0024DE8873|nr:RsfA family transcriptional regulator [Virgibacillus sp. LDC-1]
MNVTRQDAWTEEEDMILAETVLRYIRDGKTQLEAFKEVAERLSRTAAACGFRWNATIRKQYEDAIQRAKEERKRGGTYSAEAVKDDVEKDTIDSAILLLEKMRSGFAMEFSSNKKKQKQAELLEEENRRLKEQLLRYENAWQEMGKLWSWVNDKALK